VVWGVQVSTGLPPPYILSAYLYLGPETTPGSSGGGPVALTPRWGIEIPWWFALQISDCLYFLHAYFDRYTWRGTSPPGPVLHGSRPLLKRVKIQITAARSRGVVNSLNWLIVMICIRERIATSLSCRAHVPSTSVYGRPSPISRSYTWYTPVPIIWCVVHTLFILLRVDGALHGVPSIGGCGSANHPRTSVFRIFIHIHLLGIPRIFAHLKWILPAPSTFLIKCLPSPHLSCSVYRLVLPRSWVANIFNMHLQDISCASRTGYVNRTISANSCGGCGHNQSSFGSQECMYHFILWN